MSYDDTDLVERIHAVAEGFDMPPSRPADDVRRGRRRVRRNRTLVAGTAATAVAVVLGITASLAGQNRAESERPDPVDRPGIAVAAVPVWYDANGLHRGDIVEQTPVNIGLLDGDTLRGALALVRTGALYVDPLRDDVWFHPWGGEPRIVGQSSLAGPGGDPDGDIAAWFEGSDPADEPSDLVVYDTIEGREISRTTQDRGAGFLSGDHNPPGNSFLHVSAERVVWQASDGGGTFSHDVLSGRTTPVEAASTSTPVDVHHQVEVSYAADSSALLLHAAEQEERRFPDLERWFRLSPSGDYGLGVEGTEERHAATVVDTRSGELWRVPKNAYPWIAWSYGDIAMVDHTEDELLACDAARRACETVPAVRPFLLPTN